MIKIKYAGHGLASGSPSELFGRSPRLPSAELVAGGESVIRALHERLPVGVVSRSSKGAAPLAGIVEHFVVMRRGMWHASTLPGQSAIYGSPRVLSSSRGVAGLSSHAAGAA